MNTSHGVDTLLPRKDVAYDDSNIRRLMDTVAKLEKQVEELAYRLRQVELDIEDTIIGASWED